MSKGCPVYCETSVVRCRLTIQVESISQRKNNEVKSDEDDLQTLYARMYCLRRVSSQNRGTLYRFT